MSQVKAKSWDSPNYRALIGGLIATLIAAMATYGDSNSWSETAYIVGACLIAVLLALLTLRLVDSTKRRFPEDRL